MYTSTGCSPADSENRLRILCFAGFAVKDCAHSGINFFADGEPDIRISIERRVLVLQALLRGAKDLGSLTCAAHYAQLSALLCFPGGTALEISNQYFLRSYDAWPGNTDDELVPSDPWPVLKGLAVRTLNPPNSTLCKSVPLLYLEAQSHQGLTWLGLRLKYLPDMFSYREASNLLKLCVVCNAGGCKGPAHCVRSRHQAGPEGTAAPGGPQIQVFLE